MSSILQTMTPSLDFLLSWMLELVSTSPVTLFIYRSMVSPYPSNGTGQSLAHSVVYLHLVHLLERLQTLEEMCLWLQQRLSMNLHRFLLPLQSSQFTQMSTSTARLTIIGTSSMSITRMYSSINCRHNYLHCASSIIRSLSRSKSLGWHRFIASRNITRRTWKRISNSSYVLALSCPPQSFHWQPRTWFPRRTPESVAMFKTYGEGTRTRKP